MAILDRFRKQKSDDASSAEETQTKKTATKLDVSKTSKSKTVLKKKAQTEAPPETKVQSISNSSGDALANRLLIKPHVSEKAARLADQGVYVFDVRLDAEKVAIRKAVEAMYNVKVAKVRMVRGIGKPIRRGRHKSSRKDWKKALVQVKKGQTIDLYEGV